MSRALFSGMVALCLGATSAPASAFCRAMTCITCFPDTTTGCPVGGVPTAWAPSCLSYSVYRDGSPSISYDQLKEATEAAFLAWRETTCPGSNKPPSVAVNDAFGPAWCDRVEYNPRQGNANIIIVRDPWDGEKNLLALTTVSTNRETGEILDADMEINGTQPLSVGPLVAGRYDLRSLITHEAGHFLGLAHSNAARATMSPNQMPGLDDLSSLDLDDITGICTAYPPERAPACDPTPNRGFSAECALDPALGGSCSLAVPRHRSPAGATIAFTLGLGVALARRRSRRRAQKLT
jgi:Matrixin